MAERVYLADKTTLDEVNDRVGSVLDGEKIRHIEEQPNAERIHDIAYIYDNETIINRCCAIDKNNLLYMRKSLGFARMDLETGEFVDEFDLVTFTPDFIAVDDDLNVYLVDDNYVQKRVPPYTAVEWSYNQSNPIEGIKLTADGIYLHTVSRTTTSAVRRLLTADGTFDWAYSLTGTGYALDVDPEGNTYAGGDDDRVTRLDTGGNYVWYFSNMDDRVQHLAVQKGDNGARRVLAGAYSGGNTEIFSLISNTPTGSGLIFGVDAGTYARSVAIGDSFHDPEMYGGFSARIIKLAMISGSGSANPIGTHTKEDPRYKEWLLPGRAGNNIDNIFIYKDYLIILQYSYVIKVNKLYHFNLGEALV